jgi:small subunit ribosomal protein S9
MVKRKVSRKKKETSVLKKKRSVLVQKPEEKIVSERYLEAVGRRKTAVCRLRLFTRGEKEIIINDKLYKDYFPDFELQQIVISPLEKMNCQDRFRILAKVRGGGFHSQAEAVRHALARALVLFNPNFRKRLKSAGFLTRDPRMRERKKFGLKRARRAPQWQKR